MEEKLNAVLEPSQKNGLVKDEEPTNEIQVSEKEEQVPLQKVNIANIGALDTATVAPIDLMSNYWTPEKPGESKRVIFDRFDNTLVLSSDGTGELIELECAFFFIKEGDTVKRISNGSKRLVGSLQAAKVSNMMALEITYLGKKQNANNAFKSDNWSVKPLIINS